MPVPITVVLNSNLGPISHRFRDMTSFPLKTHIFLPPSFNHRIENVPLALDRLNFARPSLRHITYYSCKKFSSMT